ncbi:TonB-dependent receptor domain-containing protein [Arcobacter sp. YIC-80]|uniref:TonB-dependent receptor domain-containing protein n=1 Tax=Arcobacter sp. YIC-80 TaxID=3376683 RepID=UPI003850EB82
MNYKNKILLSLSLSASLAICANANQKDLGEVNISDTALEAHIKSITSEKLDNLQASDIKDILKSMPSVVVDGNARYSQKVYVRGLEDKSSSISIDGAKMSGQLFHHSGDQTIDAQMLKIGSIELGPNSALSSGVINGSFVYETKDPSDYLEENETLGGKVGVSYQSAYDRKAYDVAVFSRINDKLEFVGIGNISKDGEIEIPKKEKIKSKKSELKSGLIKFVIKPNDFNTIKLSYNRYEDGGNRQLSGEKPGSDSTDNVYNEISRDTYTLNYKYNSGSDLLNLDTKIYHSSQELFMDSMSNTDYWTDADKADEPARVFQNENSGFDLRNSSFIKNHKLTYGVSYDKEKQSVEGKGLRVYTSGANIGTSENVDVSGGETRLYGAYLEDEIQFDKMLLTFGLRYDVHKLEGAYEGENKQLSPKFMGEYQATNDLKLRAAYGKIFKGPSLGETLLIYSGTPTQGTNTNAQTGHNYELGFDYDLSTSLNADNSIFGFTAYTYNVDNYMHPTKNTSLSSQSDVRIWGFESVFKYEKDKLALSLSHTYTAGKEKSLTSKKEYEPKTANIHTFKIDTDYKVSNNLFLNYNVELVPGNKYEYYNSRAATVSKVKRKGYAVHNISSTYTLEKLKGAKLSFGIDNIFDKKYARHTSFGTYFGDDSYTPYEVGRNFKVKLSYKF